MPILGQLFLAQAVPLLVDMDPYQLSQRWSTTRTRVATKKVQHGLSGGGGSVSVVMAHEAHNLLSLPVQLATSPQSEPCRKPTGRARARLEMDSGSRHMILQRHEPGVPRPRTRFTTP
eukprot:133451-Hanusia_phi.AAC.1